MIFVFKQVIVKTFFSKGLFLLKELRHDIVSRRALPLKTM